jgi:hypothetical protein
MAENRKDSIYAMSNNDTSRHYELSSTSWSLIFTSSMLKMGHIMRKKKLDAPVVISSRLSCVIGSKLEGSLDLRQ